MLVAIGWLCACGDGRATGAEATRRAAALPPLEVEFAGCRTVFVGPRCELAGEQRTLTLWVRSRAVRARSERGDLPIERAEGLQGGTRVTLRVPPGAGALVVLGDRSYGSFRLPIVDGPSYAALDEATALRGKGEIEAARARIAQGMAELPPPLQDRARALLARIALSEGDHAAAAEGLRASMQAAYAAGRTSDALYDATALAYVLSVHLHDYAQARGVLARAALASGDPERAALLPHYQATLAREIGDVRNALLQFREAAARTQRLGMVAHELLARQGEAATLALMGRHAEALAAQRAIVDRFPSADPCRAVDVREQLVWLGILAQLRPGDESFAEVAHAERGAREQLERCGDPWRKRNHFINAGLLALLAGDTAAAAVAYGELARVSGGQDVLLRAWEHELEGRLSLLQGRARDALAAFEQALALSQRAGLWDNEQLAHVGRGRSLERLGRAAAACEAYAAADRLLDRLLPGVPLGEGLSGFLHEHEAATQQLLALLVRLQRSDEALEVARRARSRVIRSIAYANRVAQLDAPTRTRWEAALARYQSERAALERAQAEAWQLPADRVAASEAEWSARRRAALQALDAAHALLQPGGSGEPRPLPAPADDEALLGLFPAADGVVGFLAYDGEVFSTVLADRAERAFTQELGAAWIDALRDRLARPRRLRVVLHGAFALADVHALPFEGAPLAQRFPIAYGLDAEPNGRAPAARAARALVVADPTADLHAALREGEAVRAALGPVSSELLVQGAASRARVLAAIPEASLFHYAGHGQYAGLEGMESGLRLADGWLSLGDILWLRTAPELVVLSACEGAGAQVPGFAAGLGAAQAFIAVGAQAVVASTRPVADETARALLQAFYAARAADPAHDAVAALRAAQLRLRVDAPDADWASFRVLVP